MMIQRASLIFCLFSVTSGFAPVRLSVQRPSMERSLHVESFDSFDHLLQNHEAIFQSASHLLADAAVASDKSGPWQEYLKLFKNSLSFVHSTIDGPLRSVGITQTWGISIALFTAMARSLLIPLSIQQSKSSEYVKALKPYMTEIKKKYKNNQDAQNRAVAKLYEDADQNPLAGCLVSLAQLPIFLGLYRGVRLLAQEGKLEESFLWIPSLEGPVAPPSYQGMTWLTEGWKTIDNIPTPPLGWEATIPFLIMPALLVVLQAITMKTLQPPIDEDSSQEERETLERTQRILKFLPLMIGFFSLQVPAGLTIYWFTSNIFTLSQSLAVRAYFAANPPQIELPDYWDTALGKGSDNLSAEDRRKASEAGISVGPTFQDMQDEARFHSLIERRSFREETAAWERAESKKVDIPAELEAWVKSSKTTAMKTPDVKVESELKA